MILVHLVNVFGSGEGSHSRFGVGCMAQRQ